MVQPHSCGRQRPCQGGNRLSHRRHDFGAGYGIPDAPQETGYIWVFTRGITVGDPDGIAIRMAGSQTDMTEGKIADPLTGPPNRLYLLDKLEGLYRADPPDRWRVRRVVPRSRPFQAGQRQSRTRSRRRVAGGRCGGDYVRAFVIPSATRRRDSRELPGWAATNWRFCSVTSKTRRRPRTWLSAS